MKKVHFIFFITSSILITSCNFSNKFNIIGDNNIIYGKVKFITELEYEMNFKFDELQIDKPSRITYYWFNERGNLIKEKEIGLYRLSDSLLYEYDLNNKLIKKNDFYRGKKSSFNYHYKENLLVDEIEHLNDSIIKKTIYEYSNLNKKRKGRYMKGNNEKIIITEFDDNGNKTSERTYNNEGTTRENSYQYSYNEKGLLLSSKEDYSSGVEYTYNKKNLKISKKDAITTCKNYEYEDFDRYGNWLKLEYYYEFYSGEGHRYLIERKIKYY